jgi:large subunit ribosomal protein L6
MSRIGKLPIKIPAGVTINVNNKNVVTVKGPKGELTQELKGDISVKIEDGIPEGRTPYRTEKT